MTHTVRLPKGWAETTLGAVFRWGSGGTPRKGNPSYYDGDIPWAIIGDLPDGAVDGTASSITERGLKESSAKWVEPHSVLVAMYGSIGKLGINSIPLTTNQAIAFTNPDPVPVKYLFYYLMRERHTLVGKGKGGTQSNISQTVLKAYPFIAAPLSEQHRIVEAIESYLTRLDDAVASLERVQRNLERYRASVLKAAVEGRLVPTEAALAREENRGYEPANELLERILAERKTRWIEDAAEKARAKGEAKAGKAGKPWTPEDDAIALAKARKTAEAKYKEPAPPDTTDLPDLPEGWCWTTIEQLASDRPRSIQSGPFGSSLLHSEFQETGKLVIGIDNVQDGSFSIGSEHRISQRKFEELARFKARPKDVLVTVMGTIGRCCVIPADIEEAIITKHVYRVTTSQELVIPEYLLATLRADSAVRAQMFGQIRGQTRPGLNGAIIKQLAIPVPPIAEQIRMLARAKILLSRQEPCESQIEKAIARAARLRQSILKWAFEGKLVEQDSDDEPASVLLERIRSETARTVR